MELIRQDDKSTIILAVFLIFTIGISPSYAVVTISSETYRSELWGPTSDVSQLIEYSVQINSSGTPADQQFLNVVRDDGTWVVQNLPAGFEPGTSTMATSIDSSLFIGGVGYETSLSPVPIDTGPIYSSGSVMNLSGSVNYLINDAEGVTGDPYTGVPGPGVASFSFGNMLDFAWHTGMPDLSQGKNECVPASSANSMKWLDDTYNLGLGMTVEDIFDELDIAMETNTDGKKGTTPSKAKLGKDTFVEDNNLNIENHWIGGGAGGKPTVENILEEMKKGQDIELFLKGSTLHHVVTLVGILDLGSFGTGLAYNDPGDGGVKINFSWLGPDGTISLGSYAGAEINHALAESVVPEPATVLIFGLGGILIRRKKIYRAFEKQQM